MNSFSGTKYFVRDFEKRWLVVHFAGKDILKVYNSKMQSTLAWQREQNVTQRYFWWRSSS